MAYTYTAIIQYQDSDGRFANLTNTATITAYDLAGNSISSPSLTNITTGVYKCEVTQNDLEDVIFRVVPHADDQANFADVCVMQDKITHVLDDADGKIDTIDGNVDDILVDTGITIPAEIAVIDEDVWTYSSRTLTQSATSITSAVSGSSITQTRGDSWDFDIDDVTLDANKQQFFIKNNKDDADSASLLAIDSTGLLILNGSDDVSAGDASLSYAGTTLTVTVKGSITAQLSAGTFYYGIQYVTAGDITKENYAGVFIITKDIVRATS